ncbi:DUF6470 family protein [Alkalicoccobacillus gibsonii]|uniref:DUF6470 family protein n=1 Tax=Alkalicoccobacillus gibsonii TaxID=79881 RepID=UPI003512D604
MITSQIQIQTTDAKLQMRTSRPSMKMEQGPADIKIHKSGSDTLEISQEAATLFIDQSKAFAEANLKPSTQLAADWAAKGQASASEYVAAKAQEGKQLTKIERGVTFARLAEQQNQPGPPSSTIAYMPHSIDRVKIQVQPGKLQIDAPNSELSFQVTPTPVKLDIPKWTITQQMIQKPSISFKVDQA